MSVFQAEAFVVGLKEGTKVAFAYLFVRAYLDSCNKKYLLRFLWAAFFIVFTVSLFSLKFPDAPQTKDLLTKAVGYNFALLYMLSLGLLYSKTGVDIWGPLKALFRKRFIEVLILILLVTVFALPDLSATVVYTKSQVRLKESILPALNLLMALLIAFCLFYLFLRKKTSFLSKMVELPELILVLALIKLAGGGTGGFANLSLIPTVQNGLTKLIHDIVHQTFITIMVPDHPILKTTTWNFIGIFFSQKVALWISLVVLFLPLGAFLISYLNKPIEVPEEIELPARRRKFIRSVKNRRLLHTMPVVLFMFFILSNWFVEKGQEGLRLYNPEPQPLVAESDRVIIPISSPGTDLRDGLVHKYTVEIDGENIRFLIIKRDDGTLVACLDACEICPPDGYAQAEGHMVCLYCRTPINIQSLGKAGGCNPIPLKALVTDKDVQIKVSELLEKWNLVKTGKSKVTIKR